MRAIQVTEFGGPEVLRLTELPAPTLAPGMLSISVRTAGVNFADTLATRNAYIEPSSLPYVPGGEVVGFTPDGRRVAALVRGGYAEAAQAPAYLAFDLPEKVTDAQALALLVQGLTAWHLLHTATTIRPGHSVLVHAAAGGVGSLAVQLALHLGAHVVATAGTPIKRAQAIELGARVSVDSTLTGEDLPVALSEANDGKPYDVVLDGVGGPSFAASLQVLAPFGRLITYGAAGGQPPPSVSPFELTLGNKAVQGFYLGGVFALPDGVAGPLGELLARTADGRLRHLPAHVYPLAEASRAHADLLARATTGKVVLDVTQP